MHIFIYMHTPIYPQYIYPLIYTYHPDFYSGPPLDDGWGDFEEYDPTAINQAGTPEIYEVYSPEMASPELSPNASDVEMAPLVPAGGLVSEDEGEYEGDDESPVPPDLSEVPLPFDACPAVVMVQSQNQNPRREIWCYHCDIRFNYISEAITHFETARHERTVEFMRGRPQFYCVICNRVPARPYSHEIGARHVRRRTRLHLPRHPNHVALRHVRACPRLGIRQAFLLP